MWLKSSRRERHVSKHAGHGVLAFDGAPASFDGLLDGSSPPVHERLFSDSTEAWMRQMVEVDLAQADDFETQAKDLLEHAQVLRRRAADFRAYFSGAAAGAPTEAAIDRGMPSPDAEVKHWVDGAWRPVCGELSGVVAESRDAVDCAGCRDHIDLPAAGSLPLPDTGEIRRRREQQQLVDVAALWRRERGGQDAAAGGDDAPLYGRSRSDADDPHPGHWTPLAEDEQSNDAYFATPETA